ncbi:LytR family transcriptional regulator [Marinithermofilum abyssi]|uniref:LytR family transcriptional regulator n=1 Tax=Marinithermofilum abyssi TaxID=1571185 RepID=A0A8J2YBR3_9BACL|nr:LytTR family DNA-binding domain-containing protein [Marinithermofilum abyssi]GGE06673.1 LytR family transcriptional regulator [Marinithermofilum abyssi]
MHSSVMSIVQELLHDWVPPEASVAIAENAQYVEYEPGQYGLPIRPGQPVPSGSISNRVFHCKKRVECLVDDSVFGIPYYGMGYPMEGPDGSFSSLTVILPPSRRNTQPPLRYVTGQLDDIWKPVPVGEIPCFESGQKKTWFQHGKHRYITVHSLQALEERLPDSFLRIHRSYIVNIDWISKLHRDIASNLLVELATPDRPTLPVGQRYLRLVRQTLGF